MHFYGKEGSQAPGTFLPGFFPVEDYRAVMKQCGIERVIVVQPNAYADDNSVTLSSIEKIGKQKAKGVAVVRPGVSDAELERLTKGGMCGLRIMTLHGGTLGFDVMDELMARVHPLGWHANIQLDGRELPKFEAQIKRLPGKFVIDHTAKFLTPVEINSEPFQSLLRLVDTGRCWVKLSAPYETSKTGGPKYEDVGRLARALVKHAPERMMWASNWPHPSARKPQPPEDADLLDLLLDWADDDKTREKILAGNPAEFYGFK
jgi:D-galactarolactone isomerase